MEWKKLNEEIKPATARIISDIILADKIIEEDEISTYNKLVSSDSSVEESKEKELFHKAKELSLSEAVDKLQEFLKHDPTAQEQLSIILKEIIISDGVCSSSEAILQTALDFCIKKNKYHITSGKTFHKYQITSFKLNNLSIGQKFVFYIEEHYDQEKNLEISRNYFVISQILASIGFQFIYIPAIAKIYRDKGEELFCNMAKFLFPEIKAKVTKNAYKKVVDMKTSTFATKYLPKKMKISTNAPHPSLLVMIGRSDVLTKNKSEIGWEHETYDNLLKINLFNETSILEEICNFVNGYNKRVTFVQNTDFNPSHTKLLYQGMYRIFFDLVVLSKDYESIFRVNIKTTNKIGIYINDTLLSDKPAPCALCALIIWASIFGNNNGIHHHTTATDEQKAYMHEKYKKIYAKMDNGQIKTNSIYNSLHTRISELKNNIRNITEAKFIDEVEICSSKYIKVMIPPDKVFVDDIPIKESPFWANL